MDVRFNNLPYLHLIWIVAVLAVLIVYARSQRRRALARFADATVLGTLTRAWSPGRQTAKAVLVILALAALVLGIIDPRWGVYYEDIPRHGNDIIFVLDVSRSMLAEDLPPNRLERAKQYIGDVLDVVVGDRVGLVTFAGNATLKCPLTINYGAMRMTLKEVGVRGVQRGGSLVGDAVRLAVNSFADQIKKHKYVVIITDGEDHESYPVEAAREAFVEKGIRIYTVGLGDESEGARVPSDADKTGVYLKHDGQVVWSKMNAPILRQMAEVGGGAYIPAGTRTVDLGEVLYEDRIAREDRREFETSRVARYKVRYQWFAGLALVLLLIETYLSERRTAEVSGRQTRQAESA